MTATLDILADFAAPAPAVVRIGWRTNERPAWEFDVPAIERAARELGIRYPVTVGAIRGRGGRRKSGMHTANSRDGHRITVLARLTPAEASLTLWHELRHAEQCERFVTPRAFDAAYRANPARYERDAEACEREHAGAQLVR